MPTGSACPHCGRRTFHDQGSFRQCSRCNYIGWSWQHPVREVGRGKGNLCPSCGNQTLHKIVSLPSGQVIRRCGVCDFSGIEPAPVPSRVSGSRNRPIAAPVEAIHDQAQEPEYVPEAEPALESEPVAENNVEVMQATQAD